MYTQRVTVFSAHITVSIAWLPNSQLGQVPEQTREQCGEGEIFFFMLLLLRYLERKLRFCGDFWHTGKDKDIVYVFHAWHVKSRKRKKCNESCYNEGFEL